MQNDIETHPSQSDLLLSCSKDESVRLWNVVLCTVLAVFSGAEGHAGEVLWAACHSFRPGLFASAGMDAVMIWSWHEHEASLSAAGAALDVTLQIESPLFMTTALHGDYVDCVAWHGDLLISKSVDNCLVMWRPTMDLDLLQACPTPFGLRVVCGCVCIFYRVFIRCCLEPALLTVMRI